MNKKIIEKSDRSLKQHSALVTFTTEEEYFSTDTEKSLFTILSITQNELQKLFVEIYTPYINKLFNDEEEREKLLKTIYIANSAAKIDIDFSKINTKIIPELSEEILKKKIEAAHSALIDKNKKEKYLLEIEGIDLKKIAFNNNKPKLYYEKEELIELLDNIKDVSKYETLNRFGRTKIIDFTSFINKLGINYNRLRNNMLKASKVQLNFNYIDRKNLKIEAVSNLISSIAFTRKANSTWMMYQIPDEILKYLLMPDVYVYLQEKNIHKLEGKYSIRMYTFLKDHVKMGQVLLTKEECLKFFKLPKTYVNNKRHFINKFLNPTIADIQSKTSLLIDYELIPEYNFKKIKFNIKQGKEPVDIDVLDEQNNYSVLQPIEYSEKLLDKIYKTKRNIYVSRAWNKRVDNKIEKLLKENGEEYVLKILDDLYNNLKDNIKTTLVQYINGIIKNKKIENDYKYNKNKKEIIKKIEEKSLPKVTSKESLENENIAKKELPKVTSTLKEEEKSLPKVTSNNETNLYQKCISEKRFKTQEKFMVSKKEYEEELQRYIDEKVNLKIAKIVLDKMFIIKSEEE